MVCQIEARSNPLDKPRVDLTMEFLLKAYPPEHVVTLLWTEGLPEYKTQARSMTCDQKKCRAYGALGPCRIEFPALTGWANFYRASGTNAHEVATSSQLQWRGP